MTVKSEIINLIKKEKRGEVSRPSLVESLSNLYRASSVSSALTKMINESEVFEKNGKLYLEEPTDIESVSDRILENIKKIRDVKIIRKESERTFTVISDVHVPFHNKIRIQEMLKTKTGETLIIGGDFLDCYNLSRFDKAGDVPFEQECYEARALLELLSKNFKAVKYLRGNHDDRYNSAVNNLVPKDLRWLVKNIYEELTKGLDNVTMIGNCHENSNSYKPDALFKNYRDWLVKIGKDCWVSHGEFSGEASKKAADYIVHNFAEIPALVLQGHVHSLKQEFEQYFCYVETGCLLDYDSLGQEYNRNFKRMFHIPVNGYTEFSLDEEDKFIASSLRVQKLIC